MSSTTSSSTTTSSGSSDPIYNYALSTAKATNNKIQDFLDKFNMTSAGALTSNLTTGSLNGSYSYDPLSGLRATAQDIRITIDTAAGGDRLSQAIAETIQVASRNGYSTVPAGQGF
jgi:hypothetical protein